MVAGRTVSFSASLPRYLKVDSSEIVNVTV